MTAPRRVSLGERNRAAIAAPPAPQMPDLDKAPGGAEAPPAPVVKPARRPTPQPAKASETATVRLGMYFHPEEFDRAKAAYLADWQHGGQADTFARWIAAAIDTHARRTPQQRAELAKAATRRDRGRAGTRSFNLPADCVARMRAAILEDQAINRWPTDSAWCGDAVAVAAEEAERKAGGVLPPAPPRLPNRLVR